MLDEEKTLTHFLKKLDNIDKRDYNTAVPYPHYVLDDILDTEFAIKCKEEILNIPAEKWDRYNNVFEQKYTLRDKNDMPPYCNNLFKLLTSDIVVNKLSDIVGQKLYNDPTKNWWGIHTYKNKDYLDIHSDAGNHPLTKQKKHITFGIYLSHNWTQVNGGHLEVWDGDSVLKDDAKLFNCKNRILPIFNRMIMFTNTINAWHGNPEPVNIKTDERRIFLTLSYISEQHDNGMENNREKAFFVSRPNDPVNEEKDKLRLIRADPNNCINVYNSK